MEKRFNPFSAKGKPPWNPHGKEGGFPHVFHGSPRFGKLGRAFGRSCQRPEKLFSQKFSLRGVFSCLFGGNNGQNPCLLLTIPVGFPCFHSLWKIAYGKSFSFCGKGFGNRSHIFSEKLSTGFWAKKATPLLLPAGDFFAGKGERKRLFIFRTPSAASAWRPWLRFRLRPRFGARRTRSWAASDLKAPAYFSY